MWRKKKELYFVAKFHNQKDPTVCTYLLTNVCKDLYTASNPETGRRFLSWRNSVLLFGCWERSTLKFRLVAEEETPSEISGSSERSVCL